MRTLLNLFFVPYLRFLGKFHLYAFGVAVLVLMLRIRELMILAPMLYVFALYMTSNRHQFKDNISWMLSTFNKKTLLKYHVVAQSLVLLAQALASGLSIVLYLSAMFLLAPEASDQILPELGSTPTTGAGSVIVKGMSPLASTKEQLVLVCVGFFFLITVFSPLSLKDYMRNMETDTRQMGRKEWALSAAGVALMLLFVSVADPAQWLVVLLAFVICTELVYFLWIFNRAFVLVPKKIENYAMGGYFVAVGLLSFGIYQVSFSRFHSTKLAEEKFTEYVFMGALAPQMSDQQFSTLSAQIKDPSFILDMLEEPRFKKLVKPEQLVSWALNTKDLSSSFRLLKHMPPGLSWMANRGLWQHLEVIGEELAKRNPTLAFWQVKRFEAHLLEHKWKPELETSFRDYGPIQQSLMLGAWSKRDPQVYGKALSQGWVKPTTGAYLGSALTDRMPASESKKL